MGGENGLGAHARSFRKDDSQIPSPVTCRRLYISLLNPVLETES